MVKMKIKSRDATIDSLRAISILLMIVLHINPYFPKLAFTGWTWSWGQWVVPAFILCSLAVDTSQIQTAKDYMLYLWKRAKRLLIPYYVWLLAYLGLLAFLGHKQISFKILLTNVSFTGGIDFNWLVLLFIYITLALPFLRKVVEKSESASLVILLLSMTTSSVFLSNRSHWNSTYRWWMIIPWYGITLGILLFLKWWRQKSWRKIATFFTTNLGIFTYWYLYFQSHKITTHTYYHKYPPDIYFVSFSIWTVILSYVIIFFASKRLEQTGWVLRFLTYVSTRSYTIFFVHILVLYVLDVGFPGRPFNYLVFSTITFCVTLIITQLLDYVSVITKKYVVHLPQTTHANH